LFVFAISGRKLVSS